MAESAAMWGYWRDKYGSAAALEDYYPKLLKATPVLQQSLHLIQVHQSFIDQFMTNREGPDNVK